MDELQRKLDQRYENTNPRKVRFKLASSYSGRVLKHVYEDGQELDSPAEKYPHSFVHRKIPPSHLEMDQYCGFQDGSGGDQGAYPPPGLIAHRINVYRGVGSYKAAVGQSEADEGDAKNTVLDFGKIIIYTSNLRIIRAPPRKPEAEQHHRAHAEEPDIPPQDRPTKERPTKERPTKERPTRERPTKDASPKDRPTKDASPKDRPPKDRPTKDKPPKAKERGSRRRRAASTQPSEERGERQRKHAEDKEPGSCQQCGGSGCAPCSLCHGSKLSMLANRFNESISDLRCQACYPHGLERCPSCSAK